MHLIAGASFPTVSVWIFEKRVGVNGDYLQAGDTAQVIEYAKRECAALAKLKHSTILTVSPFSILGLWWPMFCCLCSYRFCFPLSSIQFSLRSLKEVFRLMRVADMLVVMQGLVILHYISCIACGA
jgi:hypothetical protein